MNEELIKKSENIDKNKEDLSIIEKFEHIYSNFKIAKHSPKISKIIKDEEPSPIIHINDNEDENNFFLDEKNLYDKNFDNYILRNPLSEIDKNIENKTFDYISPQNDYIKNQKIKSNINSSKKLLNRKILENKNNNKTSRLKSNLSEYKFKKRIIRNDSINKDKKLKNNGTQKNMKKRININSVKIYNSKYNNNKEKYKSKNKKDMKDIYRYISGIFDDDSYIDHQKKYNPYNAYERLYNQGFYVKNKSQINILENIDKIKKERNHDNISKKSRELLGILNKNNNNIKYDKNNIYKPIKSNIKNRNFNFTFNPIINNNSKKIVKKMEFTFERTIKPKSKIKIEIPQKKSVDKNKYNLNIKRINDLYLNGVEKIKKRKLKSCSCSHFHDEIFDEDEYELNKNNSKKKSNKKIKNNNSYYKQIQWKKKVMLENLKKKQENEYYENYECTFKPEIIKRDINYLFKNQLSYSYISNKKNKSYYDIYYGSKKREFSVSKKRFFIINKDDLYQLNNNKISSLYSQKSKDEENIYRYKLNEKNIKLSLIKRKLYNLEKFFEKQNL